jgi:hypothetical protein
VVLYVNRLDDYRVDASDVQVVPCPGVKPVLVLFKVRWRVNIGPGTQMQNDCALQVIEGVTRVLGENIWDNTFIALTHGRLTSLPGNLSYGVQ